jgi:putative MATE family efflux protein
MVDLTEGNETRAIVGFAIPMLIGNVFQQLYTMVDSIVVGQGVGKEALGAIGASFPIIFLMVSMIMGVTMGATIMLSQFFGAKEHAKLRRTMDTAYIFLFVASIVVSIAGVLLAEPILLLIRTPVDVLPFAVSYLQIMFAGMVFLFGYNTVSAVLRGLGDSKRPLYFLMVASLLNIVLDLLFVMVFGWGIAGAAWATVISQGVSLVIGIVYMQRQEHLRTNLKTITFDRGLFRTMVKIGLPTGIQQSLVSLGFVALTRIVNPFGTNVIAGYTAATRLDSFAALPAMNISMAVSTFVGQNLGAGKPERVRRGFRAGLVIAVGISLALTVVLVVFRTQLIGLFSTDADVLRYGAEYLTIVSSFYVVFAAMFITGGVLRGAGDTLVQMVFTLIALWIVRIPVSALLSGTMGTAGIWWGVPAGWVVGFTATFAYYLTGRWKRKVIVKQPAPTPA